MLVVASLDQDLAAYSESFLRRAASDRVPFYLVHAFSKVHSGSYPAEGWVGRSPARHPYKDAVMEVDAVVGRLTRVLEETRQAENTLVFFTSDNGPQDDTHPDAGHTPFRGRKGSTWEGGVRVPGIAWWPGSIRAGRVSDGLFDILDLFNTALTIGASGDRIPADHFTALRWQEYKTHYEVLLSGDSNAVRYGALQNSFLARTAYLGWIYNLYTDPAEQHPLGLRKEWIVPMVQARKQHHLATLREYPPKPISSTPW